MTLIEKLRQAREKATQGEWKPCHHLESKEKDESCPCGFSGDVWSKEKDVVLFTMGGQINEMGDKFYPEIEDRAEVRANAQLACLAANHMETLLKVIEIQREALERAAAEFDFHGLYDDGNNAGDALAEVDKLLEGE